MIEVENLPLPDDWSLFKTSGKHSPKEIDCIKTLFADDPRLEEFGVAFWIEIYRAQKKKRRKSGFRVIEATVTKTGMIRP
ncbi:MAG: hypothetical protein ACLQPD_04420 [Desulfomonilaceae bacterium]